MLFGRLKQRFAKTSAHLTGELAALFRRGDDARFYDELEMRLLAADVGATASLALIEKLKGHAKRGGGGDLDALLAGLRDEIAAILSACEAADDAMPAPRPDGAPFVIMAVGVNGVGKTTTLGKLGHQYKSRGLSVTFAAGDTFRAAAIEQLQEWGRRCGGAVVAQRPGADGAAVLFDAMASARAKGADVLLADTAGRLHTDDNLMRELQKAKRAIARHDESAPHEMLLVVDGGAGQNVLAQVRAFHDALGVTGIAVTKLDGTAKGGVLVAMAAELALPIRFIGIGEAPADLRPFRAQEYAATLLGMDNPTQ